jgi:hypothetical protein
MKIKILPATLLTLALLPAAQAQTLGKAKLDQFFGRLAEKNKAMGSLTIAKDGKVVYSRAIGYSQINEAEKKPLTAAIRRREKPDDYQTRRRAAGFYEGKITVIKMQEQSGDCQNRAVSAPTFVRPHRREYDNQE